MGEPGGAGGQAGSRRMQAGEPHTLATTVPGAGASPTDTSPRSHRAGGPGRGAIALCLEKPDGAAGLTLAWPSPSAVLLPPRPCPPPV